MWLKNVSIDGFKSYGQEAIVGDFAPQFNAITGLNGSGKSNILDSICYVMALKSLQQMRVNKLDDLVYKSGQAGVRKARVILTFDNTDKATSPPLYRKFDKITITRAIVVGGRDRYTINGKVARPSEVHALFHSVGLNVNNPHFLIMQGRITRVINMRPSEILSLVEEAAGTKIYENKRRDSENRIQRKEAELNEIESIVKSEIDPQMEKLGKDRECHTQWTKLGKEITTAQKLLLYQRYDEMKSNGKKIEEKRQLMMSKKDEAVRVQGVEASLLEELNRTLCAASSEKGALSLKEELTKLQDELERQNKKFLASKVTYEGRVHEQDEISKQTERSKKALINLDKKKNDLQKGNAKYLNDVQDATKSLNVLTEKLTFKERELENLRSGKLTEIDESGNVKELITLISEQKAKGASLKKDIRNHESSILMYEEQLKGKPSEDEAADKLNNLKKLIRQTETRLASVETQITKCQYDENKYDSASNDLRQRKDDLKIENRKSDEAVSKIRSDRAKSIISQSKDIERMLQETYPGDASTKKGVIGQIFTLFKVKNSMQEYTTALEQIAGSKLTNCVVKDDVVAEKVFKAAQSRKRAVTCIPLNRIKPWILDKNLVAKARRISSDVYEPIDLLDYINDDYEIALRHAFSGYLVCRDKAVAKEIIRMGLNCVTIDGDSYNTSGNISGGSTAGFFNLVKEYRPMFQVHHAVTKIRTEIDALENFIESMELERNNFQRLKLEIEKETRTLKMNNNIFKAEQETSVAGEREALIEKLNGEKASLEVKIKDEKQSNKRLSEWQKKMAANKSDMNKNIGLLEQELPKLRKDIKSKENQLEKHKNENTGIFKEVEDLTAAIEQKQSSIDELQNQLQELNDNTTAEHKTFTDEKLEMERLSTLLKEKKDDLTNSNEMLSKMKRDIEKKEKQIIRSNQELMKLEETIGDIAHHGEVIQ